MSNVKVAPMQRHAGDHTAGEGTISVAALEAAMPKRVAQALSNKVDLYVSVAYAQGTRAPARTHRCAHKKRWRGPLPGSRAYP